jgi:type I restriction enzyme, S subunit
MNMLSLSISEFCKTGSGTTPSRQKHDRYYGGNIPWVKSGELRESIVRDTEEKVTEDALTETSLKIAPKGAVLVAMYGANVGRVGILGIEATTNQAICYVVPDKEKADSRYIFHALQQKLPEFISRSVGGAQPNISQQIIKETKIPLPPILEQKRIAAILDKAEEVRSQRRQALEQLDAIGQSIFIEMFGDPVTNPMEWTETTYLGEVADIVSGITKGRKLNGKLTREIPYLAVINVQDKKLYLDVLKTIEASEDEIKRYRLQKDDLLLTEGGDPDKLGRGTLWNEEISECISL